MPSGTSKGKWFTSRKVCATTPPLDDDAIGYASLLLDYVPLRPTNAHKVRIGKNSRYLLVTPAVPKGV